MRQIAVVKTAFSAIIFISCTLVITFFVCYKANIGKDVFELMFFARMTRILKSQIPF
jgi:hypothetical protein